MSPPLGRVLILSASAGAGHVRAAQAIESACRQRSARAVRHVDALDFTNKLFRRLYSKTYIDMCNRMPEALGWLYDHLDTPWQKERRRLFVDKLNTRPFVRMVKEDHPDVIVCTHFLPAEIVSWLKAKGRLACPQAIAVTDFDVHAMWLCHHYERYFVAIDETRLHLEKLGIPAEKITVTGIPIDPVFAEPRDAAAMRGKHGLEPERATLLLSAGGFGVGNMENIVRTLALMEHTAQIVVVCGRNEELRTRLARVARGLKGTRATFHILGYTTEMHELMAASDVLVGKPGGLTSSEALASGLPLMIVNPIPGQEERNSDHLLEEGVALRCNNLPVLCDKLDRLLADPAKLAAMRDRARLMGRPRSALDIADALTVLS